MWTKPVDVVRFWIKSQFSFHVMESLSNWNEEFQGDAVKNNCVKLLLIQRWSSKGAVQIQILCLRSPVVNIPELQVYVILWYLCGKAFKFQNYCILMRKYTYTIFKLMETSNETFFQRSCLPPNLLVWCTEFSSTWFFFWKIVDVAGFKSKNSNHQQGRAYTNMLSKRSADDNFWQQQCPPVIVACCPSHGTPTTLQTRQS